jgi:hypothetical protein
MMEVITGYRKEVTMANMTGDRLASLTDEELLAYEREHHRNPYMSLGVAKEMRKIALKFWHLRHR